MQLRRCLLAVSLLIGGMPVLKAQTMTTPQYIAMYKDIAIDEMKRSGIPASITLAQGVLETQSGNGWLCINSNNHFGIKCKNNWTGETVHYDDDASQECFRKYPNAADSYKDHSDFLKNNPRYSFLFQFQQEDYKSWAFGLKQAGYATSKTYPQQLIKIIEDYNLQQYTMEGEGIIARSAPSPNAVKNTTTGKSPNNNNATASKPIPSGVFEINDRKVIYVSAGTALIKVANDQDIKLRNLVKYNDLENDDPLPRSNYIFLQKKAKSGKNDFHVVKQGETMYDISQAEGIQLRWLRRRNHMKEGQEPAAGEKLALAGYSSGTPQLAKIPPPEDPTEGDLNPKQIVKDVETEIEKQQQASQQQTAKQQQQPAVNKLPEGMVDDLKKIGEVTPAGTTASTSANTSAPAPAKTNNTPKYTNTNPAPPVATTTQGSKPANNPGPQQPVATTTPTAPVNTPAPQPAPPAASSPATTVPAATPVATQPDGLPDGTIRQGNMLYHDVTSKETLYGIAKRYNVTVEQLQEWNHLEAFDIKIGQRLLVGKI